MTFLLNFLYSVYIDGVRLSPAESEHKPKPLYLKKDPKYFPTPKTFKMHKLVALLAQLSDS